MTSEKGRLQVGYIQVGYIQVVCLRDLSDNAYGIGEAELLDSLNSIRREGLGQRTLVQLLGNDYRERFQR